MRSLAIGFLVIGNELLQGFTTDTNSTYLSRKLTSIGHRVVQIVTIGDEGPVIVKNLRTMLSSGLDVIFVCGGLGSTPDDVTMAAVGKAIRRPLILHTKVKAWIQSRMNALHAEGRIITKRMDAPHIRMAHVPKGGRVLHNKVGTAPGTIITLPSRKKGCRSQIIIILPGVPKELKYLYSQEIEGKIIFPSDKLPFFRELKVKIAESTMHDVLNRFNEEFPNVYLGSYPQDDRTVILRISGNEKEVRTSLARLRAELKVFSAR